MPAADLTPRPVTLPERAREMMREHPVLTDLAVALILTLLINTILGGTANVFLALLLLALLAGAGLALRRYLRQRRSAVRARRPAHAAPRPAARRRSLS